MLKRPFGPIAVVFYATACLGVAAMLLFPALPEFLLTEPLYAYSICLLLVSAAFVAVIVRRSAVLCPSVFLLAFFVAVPLLGALNARQYFGEVGSYRGRKMPSFEFPTLLWGIGTVSFFGGVLLSWLPAPKRERNDLVLWDPKRIVLCVWLSFMMATLGTLLAFYKIGYVPLLRFDVGDARVDYGKAVGALALRFSHHWPVPALLSSTLFFLKRGKTKYIYLGVTIVSAMGAMFYAQRTGLVWIVSAFALMYLKVSRRPRPLHVLAACAVAVVLVYGLMVQAEYRGGDYPAEGESRLAKHAFLEWSQYSIVVNEARSRSEYLGWEIFVGPFFAFVPQQIYGAFGQDKTALMQEYSAVYYYGREFGEPYGVRVTPIGEAFAAYGVSGVIFQMLVLGLVCGALERAYFRLEKRDARLCLACYGLSLMSHLPITTMWVLVVPLTVTGVFVVAYYFFGRRRYKLVGCPTRALAYATEEAVP